MGLRQKSRRIRLGFWEYLALLLMACTVLSALLWRHTRVLEAWELVPARVVGISLIENSHQISAARPQLRIHYAYVVQGRIYSGEAAWGTVTRALYDVLPHEALDLLQQKGYMNFADLPPHVRVFLSKRGIEGLDSIPAPLLETLRVQGYKSVRDFPNDLRVLAREGEYEAAARELERLLEGPVPPQRDARTTPEPLAAMREATPPDHGAVAPLGDGGVIRLWYQPENPANHQIARVPQLRGINGATILIVVAFITLSYCGLVYPRVKQRL